MKLKQIVLTTGLALVAGQALALPALGTTEIFISGSSAQQTSLGKIVTAMCQPDDHLTTNLHPIEVYYDNGAPPGNNHRAYYCTIKPASATIPASIANKKVLINNRAEGGSAYGVNPVADTTILIDKMKVIGGTCVATTNSYPAVPQYLCPTASVEPASPDAGVSDVEPKLFTGINLPPAFPTALTNAQLGTFAGPFSEAAVGYGIALTDNVLAALATTTPIAKNLTRSQVTSLITPNAYSTWDNVSASLAGKPVIVCRRAPGSGSQAAMNAYFGGFPCTGGAAANPATAANNTVFDGSGYTVIENATTGGVINCMNNVYKGLTVTDAYTKNFTFTGGPGANAAIGIIGLEKTRGTNDNWDFAALDGTAENIIEAATGRHDFYVEQTIQWRSNLSNTDTVPKRDFLGAFTAFAGDPAILAGIPGVAALPQNGWVPTFGADGKVNNQVMRGTRQGNTCSASQLFY